MSTTSESIDWKQRHADLAERYRRLRHGFEKVQEEKLACENAYKKLLIEFRRCQENWKRVQETASEERLKQLERYQKSSFEEQLEGIKEQQKQTQITFGEKHEREFYPDDSIEEDRQKRRKTQ